MSLGTKPYRAVLQIGKFVKAQLCLGESHLSVCVGSVCCSPLNSILGYQLCGTDCALFIVSIVIGQKEGRGVTFGASQVCSLYKMFEGGLKKKKAPH